MDQQKSNITSSFYVNINGITHLPLFFIRHRILLKLAPLLRIKSFFKLLFLLSVIELLLFSQKLNAALFAVTTGTIEGTPPYLTFDKGQTHAENTYELLNITLSDQNQYSKSMPSFPTYDNPIILPKSGQSMDDVNMLIPKTKNSIDLKSVLTTNNLWKDDDGDGEDIDSLTVTGTLNIEIRDANNNIVNRNKVLEDCYSPYKVTLSNTEGEISTQYGLPNITHFDAASVTYFITSKIKTPYICWARPSLVEGAGKFAGSTRHWDPEKGFLLQSSSEPWLNFPTVGANNLFFTLKVASNLAKEVRWTKSPANSGLGLTVSQSDKVVTVNLVGPSHNKGDASSAKPTTFTLYYGDKIFYSFTLAKWFIANPEIEKHYAHAKEYCAGLSGNYRLPTVAEFTNADYDGENVYLRDIGTGLFSEWGITTAKNSVTNWNTYPNSDFSFINYWAIDGNTVGSGTGNIINSHQGNTNRRIACITP